MSFPIANRVRFNNNPLIEVAAQHTFTKQLVADEQLNVDKASELHSFVRKWFPLFNVAKSVNVHVNADSDTVSQTQQEIFEFITSDKQTKISLTSEFVAIVTNSYERWEKFFELYTNFLSTGLFPIIGDRKFSRVGLRYKDVIDRHQLGLGDAQWIELINPTLLGAYNDSELMSRVIDQQSRLLMGLCDSDGKLSLTYGTVRHQITGSEAFMLDSDFFIEGDFDNAGANEYLQQFNIESRNFFQWAINRRLFDALEPQNI